MAKDDYQLKKKIDLTVVLIMLLGGVFIGMLIGSGLMQESYNTCMRQSVSFDQFRGINDSATVDIPVKDNIKNISLADQFYILRNNNNNMCFLNLKNCGDMNLTSGSVCWTNGTYYLVPGNVTIHSINFDTSINKLVILS